MVTTNIGSERCPDCGRPLQTVWDYPANELWCVRCGNRYFANIAPSEGTADSLSGFRLLLLDEASDRREEMARHFTQLGYQVTPVCHPRQALEAASFRRFDLMVLPANTSEFRCANLVEKLKLLLGGVKCVVTTTQEPAPKELVDPDVTCVHFCPSDFGELDHVLEHLVDELSAARISKRDSKSGHDLLISAH